MFTEPRQVVRTVQLADAAVDALAYGCTSGSLFRGKDRGKEIEKKLEEKTDITAVATARAVIDLITLQISRV